MNRTVTCGLCGGRGGMCSPCGGSGRRKLDDPMLAELRHRSTYVSGSEVEGLLDALEAAEDKIDLTARVLNGEQDDTLSVDFGGLGYENEEPSHAAVAQAVAELLQSRIDGLPGPHPGRGIGMLGQVPLDGAAGHLVEEPIDVGVQLVVRDRA